MSGSAPKRCSLMNREEIRFSCHEPSHGSKSELAWHNFFHGEITGSANLHLRGTALIRYACLALMYSSISFLWSIIGFIQPTEQVHFLEYTNSAFAAEILGHFLFGVVAGLPTRKLVLAILC